MRLAIAALCILFLLTACSQNQTASNDVLPPQAPSAPGGTNTAGQASLDWQDFQNNPSLQNNFAPPWDVWHDSWYMLQVYGDIPQGTDSYLWTSFSDQTANALVYDKAYVRDAATKQWHQLAITGTQSSYPDFLSQPDAMLIPSSMLSPGDNYVAAYVCTDIAYVSYRGGLKGAYACGCSDTDISSCGKWNLQRISVFPSQTCGDGVCGVGENYYNCAQDCLTPPTGPADLNATNSTLGSSYCTLWPFTCGSPRYDNTKQVLSFTLLNANSYDVTLYNITFHDSHSELDCAYPTAIDVPSKVPWTIEIPCAAQSNVLEGYFDSAANDQMYGNYTTWGNIRVSNENGTQSDYTSSYGIGDQFTLLASNRVFMFSQIQPQYNELQFTDSTGSTVYAYYNDNYDFTLASGGQSFAGKLIMPASWNYADARVWIENSTAYANQISSALVSMQTSDGTTLDHWIPEGTGWSFSTPDVTYEVENMFMDSDGRVSFIINGKRYTGSEGDVVTQGNTATLTLIKVNVASPGVKANGFACFLMQFNDSISDRIADCMYEGDKQVFHPGSAGLPDYEVTLLFAANSQAKFLVNGETTNSLQKGDVYTLNDGTIVTVDDIFTHSTVAASAACTDPDGEDVYNTAATATQGDATVADSCNEGTLTEGVCTTDGKLAAVTYPCLRGDCENGMCVVQPTDFIPLTKGAKFTIANKLNVSQTQTFTYDGAGSNLVYFTRLSDNQQYTFDTTPASWNGSWYDFKADFGTGPLVPYRGFVYPDGSARVESAQTTANNALHFDGTAGVTVPFPNIMSGNNSWSTDFWVRYEPGGTREWPLYFGTDNATGFGKGVHYLINQDNAYVNESLGTGDSQFGYFGNQTDSSYVQYQTNLSGYANRWMHVQQHYNKDTRDLDTYIDGSMVDTKTIPAQYNVTLATGSIGLGTDPWGVQTFRGDLGEVDIAVDDGAYQYSVSFPLAEGSGDNTIYYVNGIKKGVGLPPGVSWTTH